MDEHSDKLGLNCKCYSVICICDFTIMVNKNVKFWKNTYETLVQNDTGQWKLSL